MGRRNHGQRVVPTWNRVSRRKRENLKRKLDLATVVQELRDLMHRYNLMAIEYSALKAIVLQYLHSHPTVTEGGIVLVDNGNAPPARMVPRVEFETLVADMAKRMLRKLEPADDAAAPAATGESPVAGGDSALPAGV